MEKTPIGSYDALTVSVGIGQQWAKIGVECHWNFFQKPRFTSSAGFTVHRYRCKGLQVNFRPCLSNSVLVSFRVYLTSQGVNNLSSNFLVH